VWDDYEWQKCFGVITRHTSLKSPGIHGIEPGEQFLAIYADLSNCVDRVGR
jgi:hypothetical protein